MKLLLVGLLLTQIGGCGSRGVSPGEGYVNVPGGRVWYRIVGSGTQTPLLVLHGGPGVPSYYLKPLAALADERPVVFYEQLGTGRSDHPADTTLWRLERFTAELAAVRQALGLRDVHLYGHSWGTILAFEYLRSRPAGVHSLILAGPAFDFARYHRDADSLLRTMPDSIQTIIRRHERDGSCETSDYQAAMMVFYANFFARQPHGPADLDSTVRQLDPSSSTVLGGPCSFTAGGALAGYDRTRQLHEIEIPTLFVVGRYDTSTPTTTAAYQRLVPGSELVVFDSSGHLPMQDEPDRYVRVLREFLRRVEAREAR